MLYAEETQAKDILLDDVPVLVAVVPEVALQGPLVTPQRRCIDVMPRVRRAEVVARATALLLATTLGR